MYHDEIIMLGKKLNCIKLFSIIFKNNRNKPQKARSNGVLFLSDRSGGNINMF